MYVDWRPFCFSIIRSLIPISTGVIGTFAGRQLRLQDIFHFITNIWHNGTYVVHQYRRFENGVKERPWPYQALASIEYGLCGGSLV